MSEALESISEALAKVGSRPGRVDGAGALGHSFDVEREPLPALSVRVERGRAALRVIACTAEAEPALRVEATFSGGPEGMWFRLTQQGASRVFSREAVARHPALSALLRLIADEVDSQRPLSEALPLLFRSLLVYARRMPIAVPLPRWGRPLRDARVERALELLNRDISKRWTVDLLARASGLSRPALARQFLRVLGLSPMRYLTQKRMQAAAEMLLGSDAALAEVAHRVGYSSEFAFNRAFKKHYQVPPGTYRRGAQAVPACPSAPRRRPVALRMAA